MSGDSAHWEHFAHGADIGIRGIGSSTEVAFAQAALALTGVVTDPTLVASRDEVVVTCAAPTLDDLFFDWIDALVFEMGTRRMLFGRCNVRITDGHLTGHVWGEPVDRARHAPAVEVKGPTFTELRVAWDAPHEMWCAQCVVDV